MVIFKLLNGAFLMNIEISQKIIFEAIKTILDTEKEFDTNTTLLGKKAILD